MKLEHITLVVTRATEQATSFVERARDLGFRTISLPTVKIQKLPLTEDVSETIIAFEKKKFDWMVFTSANAVRAFKDAEEVIVGRPSIPAETKIAVQGSATKVSLIETFGREPHMMPDEFVLEELAKSFQKLNMKDAEVLFPISKKHRDVLIDALKGLGARVTLLPLYDTVHEKIDEDVISEIKRMDPSTLIFTFFSPSAFHSLIDILGASILHGARIATIGPVTSQAVKSQGFDVFLEAHDHTEEGLVKSLYETITINSTF